MSAATEPLKLAIIAGEPSGDVLGADLISSIKAQSHDRDVALVGVGGEAMAAQGLRSLFDYRDLSIVGISAIVAQLPKLLSHISKATKAIVAADPDVLVIIDSPEFSHRVARRVRKQRPGIPVVNYVCPTLWAWRPQRAKQMTAYVDHILSILPFEADIVSALGGPPLTYVGHHLVSTPQLRDATAKQAQLRTTFESTGDGNGQPPLCLLLPGSRRGEIKRLLPDIGKAAHQLAERMPEVRFHLQTLPRLEQQIRSATSGWTIPMEIATSSDEKWDAVANANAALAASGTVLLELSLAGVPCVSVYKLDGLSKLFMGMVTTWTAALPNLIADYPVVNEYINESVRPGLIARRLERLLKNTAERRQMLVDFDRVREAMDTDLQPAETAAGIVLSLLDSPRSG